jgi:endonuclease YncB( thermonuclease family)
MSIFMMVAMGYAELYRGGPCQAYCRELERAEAQARPKFPPKR